MQAAEALMPAVGARVCQCSLGVRMKAGHRCGSGHNRQGRLDGGRLMRVAYFVVVLATMRRPVYCREYLANIVELILTIAVAIALTIVLLNILIGANFNTFSVQQRQRRHRHHEVENVSRALR